MKKLLMVGLLILLAAGWFAITGTSLVQAQVKQGKERPLKTSQLMGGLVRPQCAALGKALKEQPADEKAWKALATQAALLNEAGHILMADGRCPDKTWADAAKTLRKCSAVILEKLDAQDLEGASGAFKAMTAACAACHKEHKKSLPHVTHRSRHTPCAVA